MILVTGGAGFIGSNLIAGLNERGYTNIAISDHLHRENKWQSLKKHDFSYFIDPCNLSSFLEKYETHIRVIFHLGAISSTTETDADLIIQTNLTLSQQLFEFAERHNIRFIYASSAATYGDGNLGFDDTEELSFLKQLCPLNAYGWSKHIFDKYIKRQEETGALTFNKWAGLKFFNVYGPNEYHKGGQKSVVAHLYPKIAAGEPAKLFKSDNPHYPDGGQKRDFVWVEDCVEVMLWLMENPSVKGLFNVGTGTARTFSDLATAVFMALKKDPEIEFIDMPDTLKNKYQYFTEANIEKLRKSGYTKPMTTLEDGIRQYVQNYLMAEDAYR